MARHDLHLAKALKPTGADYYEVWCGGKEPAAYTVFDPTDYRVCTRCAHKMYADKVKTANLPYRLGERLPRVYGFKSVYPVLTQDDRTVAHVAIKNGWGMAWHLHPWKCVVTDNSGALEKRDLRPEMMTNGLGIFVAKEEALLAVQEHIDRGELPSYEDVLAAARRKWDDLHAQQQQAEADGKRAQGRLDADREHVEAALNQLIGGIALNQFQREGIRKAAAMLGIKLADEVAA